MKSLLLFFIALSLSACGTCRQNVRLADSTTTLTLNALAPYAPLVFDDATEASKWVKATRGLVAALMATLETTCPADPSGVTTPGSLGKVNRVRDKQIGFKPSGSKASTPSPKASQIWPGF